MKVETEAVGRRRGEKKDRSWRAFEAVMASGERVKQVVDFVMP
jgi:hypothetical protein